MMYRDELSALYSKVESIEHTLRERAKQDEELLSELQKIKARIEVLERGAPTPAVAPPRVEPTPERRVESSFFKSPAPAPEEAPVQPVTAPRPESAFAPRDVERTPVRMVGRVRLVAALLLSALVVLLVVFFGLLFWPQEETSPPLRWEGVVKVAEGNSRYQVGTSCIVEVPSAEFLSNDREFRYGSSDSLQELFVSCGGQEELSWRSFVGDKIVKKYRQIDPGGLSGVVALQASARSLTASMPELLLDTVNKNVQLFYKDGSKIEIALHSAILPIHCSTPKEEDGEIPLDEKRDFIARVTQVQGAAPVAVGAEIKVSLSGSYLSLRWDQGGYESCSIRPLFDKDGKLYSIQLESRCLDTGISFDFSTGAGKYINKYSIPSWSIEFTSR